MNPILKRAAMVTAAVVIADQALKIWVKTHLFIGEGSYTNWGVGISQLQLKFVEDPAMPIALSVFRLLAIGGIVYYMIWAVKNRNPHKGFITIPYPVIHLQNRRRRNHSGLGADGDILEAIFSEEGKGVGFGFIC